MNHPQCTIGLDIGTTAVKAAAFSAESQVITQASQLLSLQHTRDGAAELDPEAVYHATVEMLAEVIRQSRLRGYIAERVGISCAMHSLIPIGNNNLPLAYAMTWMDERAKREADDLWASSAGKGIYERTGTPIHPMSPLAKLAWIREHKPDIYKLADKFVSLKEFLWYQWFGEWSVDRSIASATGLYNLKEAAWDAQALDYAGIDPGKLSRIVPTTYTLRSCREPRLIQAGISPETEFTIGASDGVLANLGMGALSSDKMALTIGTSLAVRTGSAKIVTDADIRSFCYVLDDDRFIIGAPSNNGGIVLDWLYHLLLNPSSTAPISEATSGAGFAQLIDAARQAGSEHLFCLPYIAGERAPLWNANAKAVFFGLQVDHKPAHLMRAAIEGILFNAYWIAQSLFRQAGLPQRIVASGKVLETEWIRQLTADIFNLPVQLTSETDASVLGAATLARIAAGVDTWDNLEKRLSTNPENLVRPQNHAPYQRKFEDYRKICTTLMHDLADIYLA
jgi:gluconokinase